jgi:hypothetical protein
MKAKQHPCIRSALLVWMEQRDEDYEGVKRHEAADDRTKKPGNRRNSGSHRSRHDLPS